MARDYQDDYGRQDYRPYERPHREEGGLFDRIGNKLHQTWDRLTGDEEEARRDHRSSYGAEASDDYRSNARFKEGGHRSGSGTGYVESHLGRYSPQQSSGSSYGGGGAYRPERNSSMGYSARMSDYSGPPQRGSSGSGQGFSSQSDHYGSGNTPYGASGSVYGSSKGDPYGSGASGGYGDPSGYGAPSGGYGRSSMGFPRGSDYGSGGSGSMGGGYFGSGAGPWSGGPYSDTGRGGYNPQRSQDNTSESDYLYSRREQRRRGEPGDSYGNQDDR